MSKYTSKPKSFLVKNYGNLGNTEGKWLDVDIKCQKPNLRDLAVSGCLIAAGVFWMYRSAFFSGAERYDNVYHEILNDLGVYNEHKN